MGTIITIHEINNFALRIRILGAKILYIEINSLFCLYDAQYAKQDLIGEIFMQLSLSYCFSCLYIRLSTKNGRCGRYRFSLPMLSNLLTEKLFNHRML